MNLKVSALLALSVSFFGWSQVSKEQIYEMTEKGLDESMIVSIIEKNCVDFDLSGKVVVELSAKVSPEVLRTIVDCTQLQTQSEPVVEEVVAKTEPEPIKVETEKVAVAENGFSLPTYVRLELGSNKSSFSVSEIELRLVPLGNQDVSRDEIRFKFSGDANSEEEIRCYRNPGDLQAVPGEYMAYLHIVSHRKKGLRGKSIARSDLHRFRTELEGPGPITVAYFSTEKKTFKSKKDPVLKSHGPLQFFDEQHISVDGEKTLEELLGLFGA